MFANFYCLAHTRNTKVGDDFVRGVSGGERKRVSIAEMALAGTWTDLKCQKEAYILQARLLLLGITLPAVSTRRLRWNLSALSELQPTLVV